MNNEPPAPRRRGTGALVGAVLLGLLALAQFGGIALLMADEAATNSRFVRQERAARNAPVKWGLAAGGIICIGAVAFLLSRRL